MLPGISHFRRRPAVVAQTSSRFFLLCGSSRFCSSAGSKYWDGGCPPWWIVTTFLLPFAFDCHFQGPRDQIGHLKDHTPKTHLRAPGPLQEVSRSQAASRSHPSSEERVHSLSLRFCPPEEDPGVGRERPSQYFTDRWEDLAGDDTRGKETMG